MKKILSLTLAVLMLLSAVPMVYAADVDVSEGTTITLVGSQESAGESYTVTVPATLTPGQSGTVTASGNWSSKQTLKVTAPSSVTLSYGDQTMDVGITFAGIEQDGSDTAASTASATVAVADASALFGTWTGHLTYTVEVTSNVELISFVLDVAYNQDFTYQAEADMTWEQWVNSEYNTIIEGYEKAQAEPDGGVFMKQTSTDNYYYFALDTFGDDYVKASDAIIADYEYHLAS